MPILLAKSKTKFPKNWEDKNKFKMDQRKNATKPPLFRNNPQGKPISREPRMIETWHKRPRKPPIQCYGCKGDHMFIDFPHRGEKVRIFHNVQQDETMEDMGRNVPRINVALNKTQVEYHSHMIEVEGMINNQTISILIDSEYIHSYIDPKVVESFHFPRRKHGKSWLVQLDTRAKRKVNDMVKSFLMDMNELNTKEDLNILPLGSHDCLIGMD
jgi:hypothetical protein